MYLCAQTYACVLMYISVYVAYVCVLYVSKKCMHACTHVCMYLY